MPTERDGHPRVASGGTESFVRPASVGRALGFIAGAGVAFGVVGLAVLGAGISGSSWLHVILLMAPVMGFGLILLWAAWSEIRRPDQQTPPTEGPR